MKENANGLGVGDTRNTHRTEINKAEVWGGEGRLNGSMPAQIKSLSNPLVMNLNLIHSKMKTSQDPFINTIKH